MSWSVPVKVRFNFWLYFHLTKTVITMAFKNLRIFLKNFTKI
nr:MAG TPA: hypothetical protein [Caudoviricetes sp.]